MELEATQAALTRDESPDELDARLLVARSLVEKCRADLLSARVPLAELEARARSCWAKRKAAAQSREITMRAAYAAGVGSTPSTRIVITAAQKVVDAATSELREIIASSVPTCDAVDHAWLALRSARKAEAVALEAIVAFESQQRLAQLGATLKEEQARQALRQLAEVQSSDEVNRGRLLPEDSHFNPQYDEYEILLRRARPWV